MHLSLSAKLILGFAVILLIAALAGAVAVWSIRAIDQTSDAAIAVGKVDIAILECRRSEKDFILRGRGKPAGDEKDAVEKHADAVRALAASEANVAGCVLTDGQRDLLAVVGPLRTHYAMQFADLITAVERRESAFADWRQLGWDFTAAIQVARATGGLSASELALLDQEVVQPFLLLRITAVYLLATRADAQWDGYQKQLAVVRGSFDRFASGAPSAAALSASIKTLLARYAAAGAEFHAGMLAQRTAESAMSKAGRSIQVSLAPLAASLTEAQHAQIARSYLLMGILGLGMMLAAIFVAWAVMRTVARPVGAAARQLVAAGEQIGAASGQVGSSSQTLAQGASEQAGSLEETSATLEELAAGTRQNANHARQADALAKEAQPANS
ncbi:MAG TPA: hypothetical protein DCS97_10025 [Planctomycetes bacterium]|nr:hypothetical protein [Planctomycetota bacterium]